MGFPWFRNRITKTRESICCFKIKGRIDLKFLLLNDGRIILYNEETIKIYRILNNSISLELKFNLDYGKGKKGPYIIYEIEKNIILIGSSDLILIDLKRNLKILQKININNTSKNYNILKLSNGLIAIYFSEGIKIFDYDKKEKKIIKKYEIDIPYLSVKELYEINSENIIIYSNSDSFVYILNLKTKKIKNMEINTNKKYFYRKSLLIENF